MVPTLAGCKMPGYASDGFLQEYIATHRLNAIALPEVPSAIENCPRISAIETAPLSCVGVASYGTSPTWGYRRVSG